MDYNASAVRAEMNRKELRTQWDAGSIGHNIRYNRLLQNYKPTSFPVFLDFYLQPLNAPLPIKLLRSKPIASPTQIVICDHLGCGNEE
jgi:hypothetical protein